MKTFNELTWKQQNYLTRNRDNMESIGRVAINLDLLNDLVANGFLEISGNTLKQNDASPHLHWDGWGEHI